MLTATPEADSDSFGAGSWPRLGRLKAAARLPVAADSVAMFRITFGLLVAFSSVRFLAKGWVQTLYIDPANHLTYRGFGWVHPWPSPWMHLHVVALGVLGLAIAAGYRHRLATGLFIIGFAYTELIEASLYLNHYWFITLAATLLWLLPVQHHWSLDARTGRVQTQTTVPCLVVWALRGQLAAVYVFAGIAKLNADWIVRAQPMQLWLTDRTDVATIGPLLDEPLVAFAASWSGAAFDCTIVIWLLWRRTRPAAYVLLVGFHLATAALFQIGVFPWVMIVATLVFFEPDWPRRLTRQFGFNDLPAERPIKVEAPAIGRIAALMLSLLAIAQIVLPLRHYGSPGNVRWNEDGYYLSWRVMLTEKAGHVDYHITDPATGGTWEVGPELVLVDWQISHAATRPDLVHATALLLADHYSQADIDDVEVRASAMVSMNGRPTTQLIDPATDLAAHQRGDLPDESILEP